MKFTWKEELLPNLTIRLLSEDCEMAYRNNHELDSIIKKIYLQEVQGNLLKVFSFLGR